MAFSVAQTCAAVDACLSPLGLQRVGQGAMARPYAGSIGGLTARGELTVFVKGRSIQNEMSLDPTRVEASGYRLTLEVPTGVAARFCTGETIPFLVKRGQTQMSRLWPGVELDLLAHDPAWARRLTEGPAARAMATLAAHSEFVEHRPGLLQAQVQGADPAKDGLAAVVMALGALVPVVTAPPAPLPATPRWSDDRNLVAVAAVGVFFAGLAVAVGLWWGISHLL